MKLLLGIGDWVGIGVAIAVVLLLIIWIITSHNKLVAMSVQCDEAFSTIDVSLKKRFDLIPNVVNTVKGYASHESETLIRIVEARSQATTTNDKINLDNELSQAVNNLNMVVERYPDLKANANFMSLQAQLREIETELAQSRRYYNATVRQYNIKLHSFPSSIIAGFMGLQPIAMFEITDYRERENVNVQF